VPAIGSAVTLVIGMGSPCSFRRNECKQGESGSQSKWATELRCTDAARIRTDKTK